MSALLCLAFVVLLFFLIFSIFYLKSRKRRSPPDEAQNGSLLNPEKKPLLVDQRLSDSFNCPAEAPAAAEGASGEEKSEDKRRKKRARKKRQGPRGGSDCGDGVEDLRDAEAALMAAATAAMEMMGNVARGGEKGDSVHPFSSLASATQRKIKSQYDQLLQSNKAKKLTMAQVAQFIYCLVEARNELQQKSEVIRRSFKIKKALLIKADQSSFRRLSHQIYKLELEQKRLEEDAAVYNLLQEQLKLSPAYKMMLEVGENMELKAKPEQDTEVTEIADNSFEELLAREKKDAFWQKYSKKLRS